MKNHQIKFVVVVVVVVVVVQCKYILNITQDTFILKKKTKLLLVFWNSSKPTHIESFGHNKDLQFSDFNINNNKICWAIIVCWTLSQGTPWRLSCKESTCHAGEGSSIPGSGRSPLEKEMATHSNILVCDILYYRGAWWATVRGRKSQTWLSN